MIIHNAYEDSRFYKGVDDLTKFQTRNMICIPLLDHRRNCLGTLQSLNKNGGDFTTEDLELLNLAGRLIAVAIQNSRRYSEISITNEARKTIIKQIIENIGGGSSAGNN